MAVDIINFKITALADFAPVYAELAKLRATITQLNSTPLATPVSKDFTTGLRNAESALLSSVRATRAFKIETIALADATTHLTNKLVRGKFSLGEYMSMWRQTFSRNKQVISELDQIAKGQARIASSFVVPSSTRQGYAQLISSLNGVGNATYKAATYQRALNTALNDGATKLINFGKNTQWAGRQLTAGLSMPVALAAAGISKLFYDVDKELTRLAKVYGIGAKTATDATISAIRGQIVGLGKELAKSLGISSKEVASMAADLAAAGLTGKQLIDATRQASRMVVLGETDKQEAIKATIALQTAYKLNTKELTDAVNFFNAAQAATSTNMQDLIEAVPRVGPIVKGLGGTYKDMVALLTAMKEGGVPAGEAANAIKNSLGRIINPTEKASKYLKQFGIDIKGIVSENAGNLIGMIENLQYQLDKLPSLQRQQAISELFGKYQFARMTALMDNFGKVGTQSAKVIAMMGMSSAQLGQIADQQTKKIQQSVSGRFKIAVESLKADLVPIGETFLKFFTVIVKGAEKFVDILNKLGPFKNILLGILGGAAVIGPITMIVGLFANMGGQILKMVNYMRMFRQGFKEGGGLTAPFQAFRMGISNMTNFFKEIDKSLLATQKLAATTESATVNQEIAIKSLTQAIIQYEQAVARIMSIHATGTMPPPTAPPGSIPIPPGPRPMGPSGGTMPFIPTSMTAAERAAFTARVTEAGDIRARGITNVHLIPKAEQTMLRDIAGTRIVQAAFATSSESMKAFNNQISNTAQPLLMPSQMAMSPAEREAISRRIVEAAAPGHRIVGAQGATKLLDPSLAGRAITSQALVMKAMQVGGKDTFAGLTTPEAINAKIKSTLGPRYAQIENSISSTVARMMMAAERAVKSSSSYAGQTELQRATAYTQELSNSIMTYINRLFSTSGASVQKALVSSNFDRAAEYGRQRSHGLAMLLLQGLEGLDTKVLAHLGQLVSAVDGAAAGITAAPALVRKGVSRADRTAAYQHYLATGMSPQEAGQAAKAHVARYGFGSVTPAQLTEMRKESQANVRKTSSAVYQSYLGRGYSSEQAKELTRRYASVYGMGGSAGDISAREEQVLARRQSAGVLDPNERAAQRAEQEAAAKARARMRMRTAGMGVGMAAGMGAMMGASHMQEGMGKTAVQAAGMGSMMGGMFGPYGALIGLAVGGLGGLIVGAIQDAAKRAKEKAAAFTGATQLSETAIEHFGIKVKNFGDIAFKTATAVQRMNESEIDSLTAKYKAQQQSDEGFKSEIAGLKNLGTMSSAQQQALKTKFLTDLASGLTSREAQIDITAYMKSAGITGMGATGFLRGLSDTGRGLTSAQAFKQGISSATGLPGNEAGNFLFNTVMTTKNLSTLQESLNSLGNKAVITSEVFDEYNQKVKEQNDELSSVNESILNNIVTTKGLKSGSLEYQDAVSRMIQANQLFAQGAITTVSQLRIAAQTQTGINLFSAYGTLINNANAAAQGLIATMTGREQEQAAKQAQVTKRQYQTQQATRKTGFSKEEISTEINQQQKVLDTLNQQLETNQKIYDIKQKQKDNAKAIENIEGEIYQARARGDLAAVALGQQKLREERSKQREIAREEAKRTSIQNKIKASQSTLDSLRTKLTAWEDAFSAAGQNFQQSAAATTSAYEENADAITNAFDDLATQFGSTKENIDTYLDDLKTNPAWSELVTKFKIPANDIIDALVKFKKSPGMSDVVDQFAQLEGKIKSVKDLLGLVTTTAISTSMSQIVSPALSSLTTKAQIANRGILQQALGSGADAKTIISALSSKKINTPDLFNQAFGTQEEGSTIQQIINKLLSNRKKEYYIGKVSKNTKIDPSSELGRLIDAISFEQILKDQYTETNDGKIVIKAPPKFASQQIAEEFSGLRIPVPGDETDYWQLNSVSQLKKKYPQVKAFPWSGVGQHWYQYDAEGDVPKGSKTGVFRGWQESKDFLAFASGGHVRGPGGPTDDAIPARLSDGEYVIKASSVDKYGTEFMDSINAGHYADGGKVKKKKSWWDKFNDFTKSFTEATLPVPKWREGKNGKLRNIRGAGDFAISAATMLPIGRAAGWIPEATAVGENIVEKAVTSNISRGITSGLPILGKDGILRYLKPSGISSLGEYAAARIYKMLGAPATQFQLTTQGIRQITRSSNASRELTQLEQSLATVSEIIPGRMDLGHLLRDARLGGISEQQFRMLVLRKAQSHIAHDILTGLRDIKYANFMGRTNLSGNVERLDFGLSSIVDDLNYGMGFNKYSALRPDRRLWTPSAGFGVDDMKNWLEAFGGRSTPKSMEILSKYMSRGLGQIKEYSGKWRGFSGIGNKLRQEIVDAMQGLTGGKAPKGMLDQIGEGTSIISTNLSNKFDYLSDIFGVSKFADGGMVRDRSWETNQKPKPKPKQPWWKRLLFGDNTPQYRTFLGGPNKGKKYKVKKLEGIVPFAPGGGSFENNFRFWQIIREGLEEGPKSNSIAQRLADIFKKGESLEAKIRGDLINEQWQRLASNQFARGLSDDLATQWNKLIHYYSQEYKMGMHGERSVFAPMGQSNENWWFKTMGFANGGAVTRGKQDIANKKQLFKIGNDYMKILNGIKNNLVLQNPYGRNPFKIMEYLRNKQIGKDAELFWYPGPPSHENGKMFMTNDPSVWKTTGVSYTDPPWNIYQVMSHEFGHFLNKKILNNPLLKGKVKKDLRLSDLTHDQVIQWGKSKKPLIGGSSFESIDFEPSTQEGFTTLFEEIRADLWAGVMSRMTSRSHTIDLNNIKNTRKYKNLDGTRGVNIFDPTYVSLQNLNKIIAQRSVAGIEGMESDFQITDAHGAPEQRQLAYDIGYAHPEQVFKLLGLNIPNSLKKLKKIRNQELVPNLPKIPKGTKYLPITNMWGNDVVYTDELPDYIIRKVKQFRKTHYGFNSGGKVTGPGGPKDDLIPAMLSHGEYVIKADSVAKYGTGFLDSINQGVAGFSNGGIIGKDNVPKLTKEEEKNLYSDKEYKLSSQKMVDAIATMYESLKTFDIGEIGPLKTSYIDADSISVTGYRSGEMNLPKKPFYKNKNTISAFTKDSKFGNQKFFLDYFRKTNKLLGYLPDWILHESGHYINDIISSTYDTESEDIINLFRSNDVDYTMQWGENKNPLIPRWFKDNLSIFDENLDLKTLNLNEDLGFSSMFEELKADIWSGSLMRLLNKKHNFDLKNLKYLQKYGINLFDPTYMPLDRLKKALGYKLSGKNKKQYFFDSDYQASFEATRVTYDAHATDDQRQLAYDTGYAHPEDIFNLLGIPMSGLFNPNKIKEIKNQNLYPHLQYYINSIPAGTKRIKNSVVGQGEFMGIPVAEELKGKIALSKEQTKGMQEYLKKFGFDLDKFVTNKFATGGSIFGPGSTTSDSIPAMLSNGEYVVNANSVAKYGVGFMDQVNAGKFATGGPVFSKIANTPMAFANGGSVDTKAFNDNSLYNINVSVAGTNASADEIANKVMQTLKRNQEAIGTFRTVG